MERDYSRRTSLWYDDRDGDTLTSLGTSIIKVCRPTTPTMVFFLVPDNDTINQSTTDLHVEGYVRMADIPEDLRLQVRKALGLTKGEER